MTNSPLIKVLVPAGALGIPFDKTALAKGLEAKPDDATMVTTAPYYRAQEHPISRTATKAWAVLMAARAQAKFSNGTAYAGRQCGRLAVDITLEIAEKEARY